MQHWELLQELLHHKEQAVSEQILVYSLMMVDASSHKHVDRRCVWIALLGTLCR